MVYNGNVQNGKAKLKRPMLSHLSQASPLQTIAFILIVYTWQMNKFTVQK